MERMLIMFLLSWRVCLGSEPIQYELFCDWIPDAQGQTLFLNPHKDPVDSLLVYLRDALVAQHAEIQSWEKERYRSDLLSLRTIRNKTDLICWIRSFFSKQKLEGTRTYWLFWNLGETVRDCKFKNISKDHLFLFLWEPPVVQMDGYDPKMQSYFSKVFTWDDDLVDGKKFLKFYYPVLRKPFTHIPSFEDKKFCALFSSRLTSKHPKELYSEREKIIRFFETLDEEFDLYGKNWEKRKFKNYRGSVKDKLNVLKNYRYSICYENMKDVKGYITEKIFDCFAAGVVPVYWGASNVEEYIPNTCFIDRRLFKNDTDLYVFLKNISKEQYQNYLDEISLFLQSSKAQLFSKEHFIQSLLPVLGLHEDKIPLDK